MSVSLSAVCLSVCLFVCMCLSVCLYVCLPICLPICQSVCLSAVCLYVCLSVCPTVRMSDFLTVRTSHFVPVNLSGDRSQRFPKQYARMLSLWSDKKFWNVIGRHLLLGLTFGAIYQTCVLPHFKTTRRICDAQRSLFEELQSRCLQIWSNTFLSVW